MTSAESSQWLHRSAMNVSVKLFLCMDFLLPEQTWQGSIRKPPHFWHSIVTERHCKKNRDYIKIRGNKTVRMWNCGIVCHRPLKNNWRKQKQETTENDKSSWLAVASGQRRETSQLMATFVPSSCKMFVNNHLLCPNSHDETLRFWEGEKHWEIGLFIHFFSNNDKWIIDLELYHRDSQDLSHFFAR